MLLLSAGGWQCHSSSWSQRRWSLHRRVEQACQHSHRSCVCQRRPPVGEWSPWSAGACVELGQGKEAEKYSVFEEVEAIVPLDGCSPFPGCSAESRDDGEACFLTGGSKGQMRVWTVGGTCVYPSAKEGDDCDGDKDAVHRIKHLLPRRANSSVAMVTYNQTISMVEMDEDGFSTEKHLVGFHEEILDAVFAGDRHVLALATNSNELRLLDTDSQDCRILAGHSGIIMGVSSASDGSWLATCSKDQTVRVWSADSDGRYRCTGVGHGHTGPVGAVACNRRVDRSAFLVSGAKDCTVKVWDVRLAEDVPGLRTLSVRFTQPAHKKDINSVAVAPNDKLLASGSADRTAKLWNAVDGTLVGVLTGHRRGVWCVAFSPVDKCLATASGDATVRLWSLTDFAVVRMFEGHSQSVLRVVFTTAGTQLTSAGGDGLIKVWNVRSGDCMTTLDNHDDRVWAVCFDSKEECFVSGGSDSTLLVWRDCTQQVQERDCAARAEQALQEQELANLLERQMFDRALALALTLDQPFRLHGIIMQILEADGEKQTDAVPMPRLMSILRPLRDDQVCTLLRFASVWNTNARHSRAAQAVLHCLLRLHRPEHLAELADDEGVRSLESFVAYSQRHLQRLSNLLQQSSFLEYSWRKMKPAWKF